MDTKKTRKLYRNQQKLESVSYFERYANISEANKFEANKSNGR